MIASRHILMRKPFTKIAICESAKQGSPQEHGKHRISGTKQQKHHAGTNAGQGPAHTEYQAADNVSWPGLVFVVKLVLNTLDSFNLACFEQSGYHQAYAHPGHNNAIHVKGFEMKHFDDPEG